jgi:hypothetical protein
MGIWDFFAPKADGLAYNPMGLPAGANPEKDPVIGRNELGQNIRRSQFDGTEYLFEPQAANNQSAIKGAYRAMRDDPAGAVTGLIGGLAQGVWDGISVPREAMEGQPVTYGDIANMAGMVTLGAGAGSAPEGALRMGAARSDGPNTLKLYHGSPHSFDKFSMDKVGTGVGAPSAFSEGLYFSEAEKNAEHFKALGASPMIGGKKGRSAGLSDNAYETVWRFVHDEGKSGTLADIANAAEADLLARSKELPFSARRDYQSVIDELKARGSEDVRLGSNMYEVNVNSDPSSFADWDAPISQQSEIVKNALSGVPQEKTWGEVYDTGKIREADLLKSGVSGTKYRANDGTHNYVVFDDSLISILRKYGLAGLLTGGAGAAAVQPGQAQASPAAGLLSQGRR